MKSNVSTLYRQELGVISPRKLLNVSNVKLSIHDNELSGAVDTIICLHAIGHGGRDFESFEKYFEKKYRIITVDWPGHGYSGQDILPSSATRYAEILTALISKLKLENIILVGNSIGGAAALKYAYQNPSKVKKMIISNPGGLDPGGPITNTFIWWMEHRFKKGLIENEDYLKWFRNYYNDVLITDESKSEMDRIVKSAFEIAPRLVEAWHSFRLPENDLKPLINDIKTPILFAWASNDKYVQWKRNEASVLKFSNTEVAQFNAGHAPFLETPLEFNIAVNDFLKK